MTDLRQAAQQALDFLMTRRMGAESVITALRTALEQQAEPPPEWPLVKNILDEYGLDAISFVAKWQAAQQQAEPVATVTSETGSPDVTMSWWHEPALPVGTKLYTTPPQRPWQGLTDEEATKIWESTDDKDSWELLKRVEAKLKELNT